MKIYTKRGDKGQTSLIGGTRVDKFNIRIQAYGTVDELNSYVGLLRSQPIDKKTIEFLLEIQDRLFTMGSLLAADPVKNKMKLPQIHEEDITKLEEAMDKMNETLPEMRSFVLPGGHNTVAFCHIARCICRSAERNVVELNAEQPVDPLIIQYLNRLSDYFFVLSRKLTQDLKVKEIPWQAKI